MSRSQGSHLLGEEDTGYSGWASNSSSSSSSSHSSSTGSALKDALWSTTARKAVTLCSAVTIFILFVSLIAVASKSSSSSSPATPGFVAPSGIYATQYLNTPFLVYPGRPDTVPAAMPVNLTIGFIADTSITEETQRLYQSMYADGADVMVVSGDLDYINFADGWDTLITNSLRVDYPMLVAAGNHDEAIWPEYQAKIVRRWQMAGLTNCEGVVGVAHACTWKGVTIVQITPGVFNDTDSPWATTSGLGDFDFVQYIRASFTKYPSPWRVCSWHKNQQLMQTGDKKNETGWGVYNECMAWGAMIMTGHEHSYERTYQMSSLENVTVAPGAVNTPKQLMLTPTLGFVVVQGLGGRGIRVDRAGASATWWAVRDNSNTGATFSANVCKFNVNGNAKQAYCYAKNINGRVVDEYFVSLP